jgi:hypothetical protein
MEPLNSSIRHVRHLKTAVGDIAYVEEGHDQPLSLSTLLFSTVINGEISQGSFLPSAERFPSTFLLTGRRRLPRGRTSPFQARC